MPKFSVLVDCLENGSCPVYIPPVNSYWQFPVVFSFLRENDPMVLCTGPFSLCKMAVSPCLRHEDAGNH